MGKARFLYDNLITDEDMITVSSLRSGMVTTAKKEGEGSAIISVSGAFSGPADLEYLIEIDSIDAGAEVAQATFKWSDGGSSWNATGVSTSAADILLNNGVNIRWASGSGADFVVGDKWYFKGINLFNPSKMINLDRDSVYRSAVLESPNTIIIDLDANLEAKALILYDHNLTSAATITIEADVAATFDSASFGLPQVVETVTWAAGKILHYLAASATKRYWRLKITDTSNPAGYIEIAELFLGSYMELTPSHLEGYSKGFGLLYDSQTTPYGVSRKRFYNRQRNFAYNFEHLISADITLLENMIDSIASRSTGQLKSFFFNDNSALPDNTWLVDVFDLPEDNKTMGYYNSSLNFIEVMRSV